MKLGRIGKRIFWVLSFTKIKLIFLVFSLGRFFKYDWRESVRITFASKCIIIYNICTCTMYSVHTGTFKRYGTKINSILFRGSFRMSCYYWWKFLTFYSTKIYKEQNVNSEEIHIKKLVCYFFKRQMYFIGMCVGQSLCEVLI
jgi:hypothetical protein